MNMKSYVSDRISPRCDRVGFRHDEESLVIVEECSMH